MWLCQNPTTAVKSTLFSGLCPWVWCPAGIGATSTGHCHPKVVEAVREQAGNIVHAQQNIFKAHTKQVRHVGKSAALQGEYDSEGGLRCLRCAPPCAHRLDVLHSGCQLTNIVHKYRNSTSAGKCVGFHTCLPSSQSWSV
jgi:hypothetical protein